MSQLIQPDLPDPVVWAEMLSGNQEALKELHARHYKVLYRYGYKVCRDREITQDCLQELFFQLWNRRGTLNQVHSVRFYLMKWLKRELVKVLKHNMLDISIEQSGEDSLGVSLSHEDFTEKAEVEKQRSASIQKALAELSPREREVIYMRFFLELTYEEICNSLKLSYQVVMNYVHRALKALRSSEVIKKIFLSFGPVANLLQFYFMFN